MHTIQATKTRVVLRIFIGHIFKEDINDDTDQGTSGLVVAVEEAPANLERREGVDAGVLELVIRQLARVPRSDTHMVRLLHPDAHGRRALLSF